MPRVILFTILGDGIYDYIPMDKIVLVIVCCIPAVIVWWVIKFFRNKRKTHLPVEPNPPSPRSVSSRLSTSTG